jgi:hypothetical protein
VSILIAAGGGEGQRLGSHPRAKSLDDDHAAAAARAWSKLRHTAPSLPQAEGAPEVSFASTIPEEKSEDERRRFRLRRQEHRGQRRFGKSARGLLVGGVACA